MAISDQNDESRSFLLDSLYCEEEEVGVESLEEEEISDKYHHFIINGSRKTPSPLLPLLLLEQDLFWEDEELLSLFSKEKQTPLFFYDEITEHYSALCVARREAVEWMLKVKAHYGFSVLTAVLSINFFDRFLSSLHFQKDKPWMIQLAAVTCLSLAAKVEETQVPLLLDLQYVEDSKYVFEAKTIQRMELLVLSTLQWRMNPVTPLSFLDHIIRRLGLRSDLHWEFFKKCEALLLSVVADSRSIRYLPSVLATATMLHVIHQVEPFNAIQYQNQLLGVLKTTKEDINECYELIRNISNTFCIGKKKSHKRKFEEEIQIPSSPSGVIDSSSSSDSSTDYWGSGSSVCSSPEPPPLFKKIRIQEDKLQTQMQMPSSFGRVFVDVVSPAGSVS